MNDLPLPLFRLQHHDGQYHVERIDHWVDIVHPDYDEEDEYTHHMVVKPIASAASRESALAVMRLHGVMAFHDWTSKRPSWDMPLTEVDA